MSNSAFLAALSSYERAFQALEHLPESREKLEQQIDLHLDSRNALFLLGDLPRIAEHLHASRISRGKARGSAKARAGFKLSK